MVPSCAEILTSVNSDMIKYRQHKHIQLLDRMKSVL